MNDLRSDVRQTKLPECDRPIGPIQDHIPRCPIFEREDHRRIP